VCWYQHSHACILWCLYGASGAAAPCKSGTGVERVVSLNGSSFTWDLPCRPEAAWFSVCLIVKVLYYIYGVRGEAKIKHNDEQFVVVCSIESISKIYNESVDLLFIELCILQSHQDILELLYCVVCFCKYSSTHACQSHQQKPKSALPHAHNPFNLRAHTLKLMLAKTHRLKRHLKPEV